MRSDDDRRQPAPGPRARGTSDPCRDDRRRIHGPGARQHHREQRPRNAGHGHLRPAPRARDRTSTRTRASRTASWRAPRENWRTPSAPDGPSSRTTPSCSAARSRSTPWWKSPARWSSELRWCWKRSSHGKHVILMNAELDATIGPLLHVYAERHGVILSACDGDEPGVQMNLCRWVQRARAHSPCHRERQGPPGSLPEP